MSIGDIIGVPGEPKRGAAKTFEQRIYKYATGEAPPPGAQYLSTVTQTQIVGIRYSDSAQRDQNVVIEPCWLVWHYFLVDVEVPS